MFIRDLQNEGVPAKVYLLFEGEGFSRSFVDITDITLDILNLEVCNEDETGNMISSRATIRVLSDSTIEGVSIDGILRNADRVHLKIDYNSDGVSRTLFRGLLERERLRIKPDNSYLILEFYGGLYKQRCLSEQGGISEVIPFGHIVDDIIPAICDRLNIRDTRRFVQSPELVLDEEQWFTIGTPSSLLQEINHGELPKNIIYHTEQNRVLFSVENNIYTYNPISRECQRLISVSPHPDIEEPEIIHIEVDETSGIIYGVVKNRTCDPYSPDYGKCGIFQHPITRDTTQVEVNHIFTHPVEEMYISSRPLKWQSIHPQDEKRLIVSQAVGWVNPAYSPDTGIPQSEPIPVTITRSNIFGEGATVLSVDTTEGFRVGMRIGACLAGDHSNFSDLGCIVAITEEGLDRYIHFEYPLRYDYTGEEAYVFQIKTPEFSNNIFIPAIMEVDAIYDRRSYERRAPVEVYSRKGFTGLEDSFIQSRIGELPMILKPGFYAFQSILPLQNDHKHNPYPSPFFIRLRSRKTGFFSLKEGAYIRTYVQRPVDTSVSSTQVGLDLPRQSLYIDGVGDVFSSTGGIYPLFISDNRIIVCHNGFEREDDCGYSGVKRSAEIVELDYSDEPPSQSVLWKDEEGVYEFCAPPVIENGVLHLSLKRYTGHHKPLERRIIGVEPLEEGVDVPYGHSAYNRDAVKVYLRGDQTEVFEEGALVSFGDDSPGDKEYVLQGVEVECLTDHYFCYQGAHSDELVTGLYLVGTDSSIPWLDIRRWQIENKDSFSAPHPYNFEEMFSAYLNLEPYKLKYREKLEEEFCGMFLFSALKEEMSETIWATLDIQSGQFEVVKEFYKEIEEELSPENDEISNLPVIDIPHTGIDPSSVDVYLNKLSMNIVERGFTPLEEVETPTCEDCYLLKHVVDDGLNYRLVFNPAILDGPIKVRYRYSDPYSFIKRFSIHNDEVFAYITNPLRFVRLSCISAEPRKIDNESGLLDITTDNRYLITEPSGIIKVFQKRHPGYVSDFAHSNDAISDLSKLALNFNMTVYMDEDGVLRLDNKNKGRIINLDERDILSLEIEESRTVPGITVRYNGGEITSGVGGGQDMLIDADYLTSEMEAKWLLRRLRKRLTGRYLSLEVPLDVDTGVGDRIKLKSSIFESRCLNGSGFIRAKGLIIAEVFTVDFDIRRGIKTMRAVMVDDGMLGERL